MRPRHNPAVNPGRSPLSVGREAEHDAVEALCRGDLRRLHFVSVPGNEVTATVRLVFPIYATRVHAAAIAAGPRWRDDAEETRLWRFVCAVAREASHCFDEELKPAEFGLMPSHREDSAGMYRRLEEILWRMPEATRGLILAIDEADSTFLADDADLGRLLRTACDEGHLGLLTIAARSHATRDSDAPGCAELMGLAGRHYVPPLNPAAAQGFARSLLAEPTDTRLEWAVRLSGGLPALLRSACELLNVTTPSEATSMLPSSSALASRAKAITTAILESLTDEERARLASLSGFPISPQEAERPGTPANELISKGVLILDNDKLRVFSPLLHDYLSPIRSTADTYTALAQTLKPKETRLYRTLIEQANRHIPCEVLLTTVWGSGKATSKADLRPVVSRLRSRLQQLDPSGATLGTVPRSSGDAYCLVLPEDSAVKALQELSSG